jgi:hypothetical protein
MKKYIKITQSHYKSKLSLVSYTDICGWITKEHIEQYNKIYGKFKDNKLTSNLNINITSLSEFPSYKLKNYIEENNLNINITRKAKAFNTILLNNSLINQLYLTESSYPTLKLTDKHYCIPYSFIKTTYAKYIDDAVYRSISKSSDTDYCLIDENMLINDLIPIDNKFSLITEFPIIEGKLINITWGNKKANQGLEFFTNLANHIEENNLNVIFDESISNEINKESVIDLGVFQILFNMLASDDVNNHIVAQELISNHDFELSKPYILFLASKFKLLRNKSSNNKNWGMTYKHISKYKDLTTKYWSSRSANDLDDVYFFLQNFIPKYPQYKQIVCDCLTIYLNHKLKADLIKEIHSL